MKQQSQSMHQLLRDIHQDHIIQALKKSSPLQKKTLTQQLNNLNKSYPGGLKNYYLKSKKLLKESADSVNPYQDYDVGIPTGVNLNYIKENLDMITFYQKKGLRQIQKTCFVLVAGGLGQRLGYPGIKISIEFQLLTEHTFIQYYIEYILAYQKKYCQTGTYLPLVIMTSDDTHQQTIELLEKNKFYGMQKDQIKLLKQEKVPAFINNQAKFSLINKDGKLLLQTKPHGHGDIHTLLYQHGIVQDWHIQGKKWIVFFQDTNPLIFRSLPAFLGVSSEKKYQYNSITINRKPGEALGAITTLIHKQTKQKLTLNVEYNQLQSLFHGSQPTNDDGYSKYPGNINCFTIKIDQYKDVLGRTKGQISEFVNPKYTDSTKTMLKSSARLECMMQDYPKLLHNCDHVGYTSIDKLFCFTTVKNDLTTGITKYQDNISPECAGSCEADFYRSNREMLRLCGAEIDEGDICEVNEMKLPLFPMISLSPSFATCLTEMRQKVQRLKVQKNASLIVADDCVLRNVYVNSHLQINRNKQRKLSLSANKPKKIKSLTESQPPFLKIRGYKLQ